jgi:hypothetical protein
MRYLAHVTKSTVAHVLAGLEKALTADERGELE